MATDKKHIAVYLAPEIEQALIAFCEEKGLKSKKGTMFSAGVNAALAEFFGVAGTGESNTPSQSSTIPTTANSNIPSSLSNISPILESNIPSGSFTVEVLPGKLQA
ncbi:hypothetical protein [Microcoleus sp. Pol17_C1]|uniref:hypothetical protein n=1 Tax=unclassified Microcoleus TaxID=2642155 RepID=UPI002FD4B1BF